MMPVMDEEHIWNEEEARAMGYSGICPDCGSPTIDCIVADDACTNPKCNYAGYRYSGTIFG